MDFLLGSVPSNLYKIASKEACHLTFSMRHEIFRFKKQSAAKTKDRVGRASLRTWRDFPPHELRMIFSSLFPLRERPSLFDRDEARDMTNRAGKRKKWQKTLRHVADDKSSRRYEAIYDDTVTRSLSPLFFSFFFFLAWPIHRLYSLTFFRFAK